MAVEDKPKGAWILPMILPEDVQGCDPVDNLLWVQSEEISLLDILADVDFVMMSENSQKLSKKKFKSIRILFGCFPKILHRHIASQHFPILLFKLVDVNSKTEHKIDKNKPKVLGKITPKPLLH